MTKLFITGATGFIGSHLVQSLSNSEYELICLASPTSIGTRPLPKNYKLEFGDLTNYDFIKSVILKYKPEIIIHLAAITPVRHSFEFPEIYQEVNFMATVNLVQAALKLNNLEKFIFASTAEVYGWQNSRKPFTENLSLNPGSPYSVSKAAAENYIEMIGRTFGFPHFILRSCNTFGRKNETGFFIEYVITQMLKNKPVHIGTPDVVRDFMYISDHVSAYRKALEFNLDTKEEIMRNLKEDHNFYVFNFGNGLEFTLLKIAKKIGDFIAYNGKYIVGFPQDYPSRPLVETYLSLNSEKAKKKLMWQPNTSLDDGLKKVIDYWKTV